MIAYSPIYFLVSPPSFVRKDYTCFTFWRSILCVRKCEKEKRTLNITIWYKPRYYILKLKKNRKKNTVFNRRQGSFSAVLFTCVNSLFIYYYRRTRNMYTHVWRVCRTWTRAGGGRCEKRSARTAVAVFIKLQTRLVNDADGKKRNERRYK